MCARLILSTNLIASCRGHGEWAPCARAKPGSVRPHLCEPREFSRPGGGSVGAQTRLMIQLTTRRIATLGTLLLFAACGGDASNDVDAGSTGPDSAPNNPPNPSGLGPAPLDLGTSGDL